MANRRPPGTPTGGQFAPSAHPESEVALDGSASGPEAALRAEGYDGRAPAPEAPWSWGALTAEVGEGAAEELYARSGGSLGRALVLAVEAEAEAAGEHFGDPGDPGDPDPDPEEDEDDNDDRFAEALAADRFLRALADERGYLVGESDGEWWAPAPNAEGLRQVSSLPPGLRLPRGCDGCAAGDHDACEAPDETYSDEDAGGRETEVVSCCCGLA